MTSTITLITDSKITPERNFKVPNFSFIETSGSGNQTITNFMYVKHSLNLTIKVDMNQLGLEYVFTWGVNYIIIQNNFVEVGLPKKVGYFVVNKRWLAKNTIEYTLLCDVLNSFADSVEISDKTRILRQHKDRWKRELVAGQAHIGDLTTHPKSFFDYTDYGYLLIHWFQQAGQTQVICFLYDLDKQTPYLESGDYGHIEEIYFGYTGMSGYDEAKYYFVDENFNIISQLPHTSHDADKIKIIYGKNSGDSWKVSDNSSGSTILTTIPSNARYIALCGQTLTEDYSSVYVQIAAWDDLTEAQYDEAYEKFEDYYQLIQLTGNYYEETQGSEKIIPIIDRYSENISPMLYGGAKYFLREKGQLANVNWYLVYKNQNAPSSSLENPVNCYLYGSRTLSIVPAANTTSSYDEDDIWNLLASINGYRNKYDLQDDIAHNYISWNEICGILIGGNHTDNENCTVHIEAGSTDETYDINIYQGGSDYRARNLYVLPIFVSNPDRCMLWIYLLNDNDEVLPSNMLVNEMLETTDTFTFSFVNGRTSRIFYEETYVNQSAAFIGYPQCSLFTAVGPVAYVKSIDEVDRTDPKLIKIIKLPYCPANITLDEQGYVRYTDQWIYDANDQALKLYNFNTKFSRVLDIELPLTPWTNAFYEYDYSLVVQPEREKSYEMETKLYHSDYFLPKVIYDSFVFTFQLELMTTHPESIWRVQYNVSNNITSKFMFTFLDYLCDNNEVRDYNNIMYISRNNDCVIFNQQYVNYIRTGYNYDKKSMELFLQQQQIGFNLDLAQMGLGTGAGAISSLRPSKTGKQDFISAYVGIANFGMNIAEAAVSRYYSEIAKQMQLDAKKVQLQNQSTGVIDANDVDLLDVYSQNKLALKFYEVSPRMKKALFNLFYYCGYICEEQGIPDTTSRLRFNYVQAELVFVKTPNLPEEMIEALKARYLTGVTFLHSYNGQIDYDQKYENWEVSILDN